MGGRVRCQSPIPVGVLRSQEAGDAPQQFPGDLTGQTREDADALEARQAKGTPVFTPASPPSGRRNFAQLTEKKRGDGLERRPPVGIARERETSADHAAPYQCEGRTLSQPGWCGVSLRRVQLPNVVSSSESRSERPQPLRGPGRDADPVIEAYKRDIDRTLLRENLRRSPTERVANLIALQELAKKRGAQAERRFAAGGGFLPPGVLQRRPHDGSEPLSAIRWNVRPGRGSSSCQRGRQSVSECYPTPAKPRTQSVR